MDIPEFTTFVADELTASDFHPGVPDALCWEDAKLIENEACEDCSGPLTFTPFIKRHGQRAVYRAFAVCETCNTAYEW